jgi:protoporphyrinogen oxidase
MNIILGAGISGISASFELKKNNIESIIFEKNNDWGGLLDNFQINGFRFDKFIHLSFSQDDYVNSVFTKTPLIKHKPLSYNYYKGYWLKHPAQNNLFPLSPLEKKLIVDDFKLSKEVKIEELNNYEEWLRMQFGDYFAENFPMIYTKKYWTVEARELETKWVGNRMYKSTLKEIENGCLSDNTPNTYYAKEMRYPEKGGYKSFLKPMLNGLTIKTNSNVISIDLQKKQILLDSNETFQFKNLISSLPLPEICKLINPIPPNVLAASEKLNYTSGYLISLGFNKPEIASKLWFYIYDNDIMPSRVYSPSLKSQDNAPNGCSSIQAELYFNKGQKLKISNDQLLDETISKFIEMGLFREEDIIVKDIRVEKYANVIFDHFIYENRKIILDFLEQNNIITIGRFGEWDYFWSDQSMLSGINGANQLIKRIKKI